MKRAILTISIFGLLLIQACSLRGDRIFSAFDELHYIILYEKGNQFELLYNGLNTATGTYSLESDTIFLTYKENQFTRFNPNEKLTQKVLINTNAKRVKSIDNGMSFCANIHVDKRKTKN